MDSMVSLATQRMWGGISLLALSAIVLFPTVAASIANTQLGTTVIPIIGVVTVGKIVAAVGAFFGANLLMK